MIDKKLGLQLAHFLVVESHIKIEVAIGDQPIIGEHRNSRVMCHVDGFRHRTAVMRNNDKHIDAPADQCLDLADLTRVIAVR